MEHARGQGGRVAVSGLPRHRDGRLGGNYAPGSQEPPFVNEGFVRAALEWYGERKLKLPNWP